MKFVPLVITGVILILLVWGFASMDSGTQPPDTETSTSRSHPAKSPPIQVEASTLIAAYEENELRADQLYKGKRIAVTGTIDDISKDVLGTPYVMLKGSGALSGVQCSFGRGDEVILARFTKGTPMTFTCEGKGKMIYVQMADCTSY